MLHTSERTGRAQEGGRAGRPGPWVSGAGAAVGGATLLTFLLAFLAHAAVEPHYYYTAAVRSMSTDWHAFWFGALDPAGTLTVDKAPGALWLQALSVRLFGFHDGALLLPQALAAAATVPVLASAVRRWKGDTAGVVAAFAFALTPVTVVLARVNIPDTLLVLFLVCAARAGHLATADGRPRQLLVAAAWVGAAFHVKMGQAYLVLPALLLSHLCAAPGALASRVRQVAAAAGVTIAASAVWPLLVALTPAGRRPYVDGSTHDAVGEMLLHYNGLSRLGHSDPVAAQVTGFLADFGGPPGPGRLVGSALGPEIGWLLPFALVSLAAGLLASRGAARTDPVRAGWLLWGGWLLMHGVVFSTAAAVHTYYTAALAPALAALCAGGAVGAARACRDGAFTARGWAAALAGSAVWAAVLALRADGRWWHAVAAVLACGCACLLVAAACSPQAGRTAAPARTSARVASGLAAAALLLGPGAWAVSASSLPLEGLTTVNPDTVPGDGLPPGAMASLHGFPPGVRLPPEAGDMNMLEPAPGVRAFVTARYEGETYHLAVPTANTASPYLRAGLSVLPMGGFTGAAPVPDLARLDALTSSGELRYVMTGGFHGAMGGPAAAERARWVADHCTPVPPRLYRTPGRPSGPPGHPETLFDCAPRPQGGTG